MSKRPRAVVPAASDDHALLPSNRGHGDSLYSQDEDPTDLIDLDEDEDEDAEGDDDADDAHPSMFPLASTITSTLAGELDTSLYDDTAGQSGTPDDVRIIPLDTGVPIESPTGNVSSEGQQVALEITNAQIDSIAAEPEQSELAISTAPLEASFRTPQWHAETLLNPPPHVGYMRKLLHDLADPVELLKTEFDLYFPFVDNVWVRQHKQGRDAANGPTTDYYACRVHRRSSAQPDLDSRKRQRKSLRRTDSTCPVRMKATTIYEEPAKVIVQRAALGAHSHDLARMDAYKRNSVVMDIARSEVRKGYSPLSVHKAMANVQPQISVIGGRFIKQSDVLNASRAWRVLHPELDEKKVHPGFPLSNPADTHPQEDSNSVDPLDNPNPAHLPPNSLTFPLSSRAILKPYLPSEPSSNNSKPSLPHVTLTYATSMDSFLSLAPGLQTHLSGPASKAMTHYLRSQHDAILVGVGTAVSDDPTLNCRIAGAGGFGGFGLSHQPRPIVIDPTARWQLSPATSVLKAAEKGQGRPPWIITSAGAYVPPECTELVRKRGGRYWILPRVDVLPPAPQVSVPAQTTNSSNPTSTLQARVATSGPHGAMILSSRPTPQVQRAAVPVPNQPMVLHQPYPPHMVHPMNHPPMVIVPWPNYNPPPMPSLPAPEPPKQKIKLSWPAILHTLASEGIKSVMIEGGATIINELLLPENAHLISSVIVTVAPTYLGKGGVVVCPDRKIDPATRKPVSAMRFEDVKWMPLDEDVVMCGRIQKAVE